jgi:class 3 adenylate cyclase
MASCPAADVQTPAMPGPRRLAAVAFVDIVGYTILMAEDEAGTHRHWMGVLNEVLRPQALRFRGKVVKSTGDGVLGRIPERRRRGGMGASGPTGDSRWAGSGGVSHGAADRRAYRRRLHHRRRHLR